MSSLPATRWGIAVVILAAGLLYLAGNDRMALWDRDEPRYAQTSRNMVQTGDWVVPVFLGELRTAKPIFIYWCQGAAMKVLGATPFAARLPSALAMTLTLILLAVVIRRRVSPEHAFWTVLILATSILVISAAKMCLTDAVLLLFITIAQLCLLGLYIRHGPSETVAQTFLSVSGRGARDIPVPRTRPELRWKLVLWCAVGLAGLTKGPVILGVMGTTLLLLATGDWLRRHRRTGGPPVIPQHMGEPPMPQRQTMGEPPMPQSPAVLAYAPPASRPRPVFAWWLHTNPLLGMLIVVAICAPWVYLIHHRAPTFLPTIIGHDVVKRMRSGLEGHQAPPGYYLATIWGTYLPWSLLLPTALLLAWRNRASPITRFCLAAIVGPWLMFECIQTKLPHYLLPIFPPMAFLTADALIRCIRGESGEMRRRLFLAGAGVWAVAILAVGAAPWLLLSHFPDTPRAPMIALSAVATLYALVVLALLKSATRNAQSTIPRAALAMAGGMFLLMLTFTAWFLPSAPFMHLPEQIATALRAQGATHPGDVIMIDYKEPSLGFYQGGTLREESDNAYLITHDPAVWPRWMIITRLVWEEPLRGQRVPPERQALLEPIGTFRGWDYAEKLNIVEVMIVRKKEPPAISAEGGALR